MKRHNAIIAPAAAAALLLAAPSASFAAMTGTSGAVMPAQTQASIIAMGQKVKNNEVTVAYAYLPKDGFIAIYASGRHGKMGNRTIGTLALTAGPHKNLTVKLTAPVKSGERLWATLNAGTFKAGYASAKSEFRSENRPVEQSFRIS